MHKFIENIKKYESKPIVIQNFIDQNEVMQFQKLYNELPIEINNTRQKIIKKSGLKIFFLNYKIFRKLKEILKEFKMDNQKLKWS